MKKKLLLLLLIISAGSGIFAQEIDRTEVSGEVHVPPGEDAEGIVVYNISSQMGTLTDANGSFKLKVAENDRVQIAALQYQSFTVVVDQGVVEKGHMNIFLNPAITQLDEVIVRPYDLSGNIRADVKRIPTYNITKDWDLSYKNLEFGYTFEPDAQSAIPGNAAEEALHGNALTHGANILAILGGVADLLFPQGEKITLIEKKKEEVLISNNIQQRFSREFIAANFAIPENKAVDFLFYAQENGLTENLLKPENEMQLMEFLYVKSAEYKARGE